MRSITKLPVARTRSEQCSRLAACATVIVVFSTLSAAAQEIPNLVGTWKGGATAVSIGANPHRGQDRASPTFGTDVVEFSFIVKEQQKAHFAGETVGKFTETLIGGLRPPDFKAGYMLDNDGEYSFTLRDAKTMDLCYRHLNLSSKVVACYTVEKQP